MSKPPFEETSPVESSASGAKPAFEDTTPVGEGSGSGGYWSDVSKNAGKEVSSMVEAAPGMAKAGLNIASLPQDAARYVLDRAMGKSHDQTNLSEDLGTITNAVKSAPDATRGIAKDFGNMVKDPIGTFREKPIGTTLNAASVIMPATKAAKAFAAGDSLDTLLQVAKNPSTAPELSKRIMAKGISAVFGPKVDAILRRWDNPEAIADAGTHVDVAEKLSGAVKKLEGVMSGQDKKAWATLHDLPVELQKLPDGMTENDVKAAAVQMRNAAIEDKAAQDTLSSKIREFGGISGNAPGPGGIRPESEEYARNVPVHLRGRFPPDQMAQMLADAGVMPEGSGASELYAKLSNLKPTQQVDSIADFTKNVRRTVIENSFDPSSVDNSAAPIERKAIDQILEEGKNAIGNPVGKSDHQAVSTLNGISQDIKAFGKYISEKDSRSIIQKIRDGINWEDQSAQTSNEALKGASAKLDDILKTKNPEYKKAMVKLASNMDLHSDIKRLFNLRRETNQGLQATETTASKLQNLSRANKDISKETLDSLKKVTKTDVRQMATDASLAKEFQGGRPNGSRRVAFGTVVGAGVGKLVGSPTVGSMTGASLGLLTDVYGGQMAGRIVDTLADPKFSHYAGIVSKAAQQGAKNLSAVQSLLMQSDPEYRQRISGK